MNVLPTERAGSATARNILLFILALIPRALAGRFVTVDEADHWFPRADLFLRALQRHDWAGTNLIGHPGVTTMWLGTFGVLAHRLLTKLGFAGAHDTVITRELLRLPVALVTALCICLAVPLLARLFGRRLALLAGLLWAGEPFLVAHSQLLHTDALLTSFMTLALLAAMLAFRLDDGDIAPERPLRRRMLVASGVAGGLAFLTKSPSIVLLPMLGLIGLVGSWHAPGLWRKLPILPLLAWGGVAVVVWFALWPAAWVNAAGAVMAIYRQVRYDGAEPHAYGNFFLGHAIANPGPLFYPVTVALRLAPWSLAGIVLAIPVLIRRGSHRNRAALVLLAIFVLLFVAVMTVGAKKFDRYVLPIYPSVDILAAAGLLGLGRLLRRWTHRDAHPISRRSAVLLYGGVACVLAANIAWYHPYELAYFNQALGGGAVAARTIPVGWGEGYEQVGAYLSSQYAGCDRPIAAWFGEVLVPYTCDTVVPIDTVLKPGQARYAVLYIDQILRNDIPQSIALLRGTQQPIYTIRIHSIDYAYIYELLPPVQPLSASFGSALRLQGYDLKTTGVRNSGILTATLAWQAEATAVANNNMFAHLLDAQGKIIAQVDVPLVGPRALATVWQPGRTVSWDQPIPLRRDLPAGNYWLALGVYSRADFKRLPLQGPPNGGAPADGNDALLLGPVTIH